MPPTKISGQHSKTSINQKVQEAQKSSQLCSRSEILVRSRFTIISHHVRAKIFDFQVRIFHNQANDVFIKEQVPKVRNTFTININSCWAEFDIVRITTLAIQKMANLETGRPLTLRLDEFFASFRALSNSMSASLPSEYSESLSDYSDTWSDLLSETFPPKLSSPSLSRSASCMARLRRLYAI